MSAKQVQLVTERVGDQLCRQRDQATRAFLNHAPAAPAPQSPPALIVITADGGRVQTRQDNPNDKWKEDKVGLVYEAVPAPEQLGVEYEGPRPVTRSVLSTMDPWDRLGEHLSALGDGRGYAHAAEKVFISDAASAIKAMRETCFPDAVFILDWKHATDHLAAASVAAFGAGEKAALWRERQKDRLWNGHMKALLAELKRISDAAGPPAQGAAENDPRRILSNTWRYVEANQAAMNYPLFRRKGWPIGSGVVESAVKQVGKRVKGLEKHWSCSGAEQTLQVVACLLSEDHSWDRFWQRCPLAPAA